MGRELEGRARAALVGVFATLAALLVAAEMVSFFVSRDVGATVDEIDRNALASVQLLGRMALDVEREHVLVERHILASRPAEWHALDAQISQVMADYARAAAAYAPLAKYPGETEAWRLLDTDVATVHRELGEVLALSRANRDTAATARLATIAPVYAAIDDDVQHAIDANRRAAARATVHARRMLEHSRRLRFVLATSVLVVMLVSGLWVTRAIGGAQRELARQAAELERRNDELDAFTGRVAHDLRNPLNKISLAAALLAERAPGQPAAARLQRGVDEITKLLDDLLELSRLGGERVRGEGRTEVVADALARELGELVRAHGGTLRLELAPACVRCKESLLHQLLWNLGENAVKYAREGVPPELVIVGRVEAGASRYELRVADNGRGMSPEDARRAFEPLYRGADVRTIPGTGLGLAIVHRIVDAAGGQVRLESEVGRGTTFVVELPLGEPVTAPRAPARSAAAAGSAP